MTKIVGFLLTRDIVAPKVDIFDVGLKLCHYKHNKYTLFFWGIGDIEKAIINEKYSLSFPLHDNLLDRNILISFEGDGIIIENDWLGSIPVFYNSKEHIVSTLSNFCLRDKRVNHEALLNFCEFGYSVFEQTMFEDVKFMRYYSKLIVSDTIEVKHKEDPVLDTSFLDEVSNEDDVINYMQEYIQNIEKGTKGDIVLPTSGGYDSRILNYFINDKQRIQSFTYGISQNQSRSSEVVHAKKISEIYSTKWEQIELEEYHKYMDQWVEAYGFSTHLHGMYHIEFYMKMLEAYRLKDVSFLSGIFGDIWAGSINYKEIKSYQDIVNLAYTHGLKLDVDYLTLASEDTLKKKYFKEYSAYLENDKLKAVFTIRMKLMLISYLTQIPEYFGMPVWTPFLNFEIVKKTLNISESRRKNRIWQKDFFKKVGLNLEEMNLQANKSNKLDYEIARYADLEVIDVELMKGYIEERRLIKINRIVSYLTRYEHLKNQLLYVPKVGGVMRRLGLKNEFLTALHEYYVIKAIEKGLKYES